MKEEGKLITLQFDGKKKENDPYKRSKDAMMVRKYMELRDDGLLYESLFPVGTRLHPDIYYVLYLFVFLLAVLKRRLRALWKLSFIVIARMFDWVYLIWFGRYPFRVTQIIYVAELVLLIALILKEELWKVDNGKEKTGSLWKRFPAPIVSKLSLCKEI